MSKARKVKHNNWTHEEHILAFNLYSRIPFGTMHTGNPRVVELAGLIGRTDNAVAIKLSNFARLDPSLRARGVKGLVHGAHGEETVWNEFAANPEALAFESERLLAIRLGERLEEIAEISEEALPPLGIERETLVRIRVNQCFFRNRILSGYDFKCSVTGLGARELLVASHIVPWAEDAANRLNPRNGLCLNALHDRAFDRHLMWIDEGNIIRFSKRIQGLRKKPDDTLQWLIKFDGQPLLMSKNLSPDPVLLKRHRDRAVARAEG